MRLLGGWIALTPELDAKLLFGRHVWDCAQHADLWGRRLPELRAPAQQSEPANDGVVAFSSLVGTDERHLTVTNPVYEPPTRRILARCIEEERRHAAAGAHVLQRLLASEPALVPRVQAWESRLLDALAAAGGISGDVEAPLIVPPAIAPDPASVAQDLVPPPPPFERETALADLTGPVEAHRRALTAGGATALQDVVAPQAGPEVVANLAALDGPFTRVEVVGCARLGRQRIVKLRLHGPRASVVLQERWAPSEHGWRIAAVEVAVSEPAS
jgi:hypothetical protein